MDHTRSLRTRQPGGAIEGIRNTLEVQGRAQQSRHGKSGIQKLSKGQDSDGNIECRSDTVEASSNRSQKRNNRPNKHQRARLRKMQSTATENIRQTGGTSTVFADLEPTLNRSRPNERPTFENTAQDTRYTGGTRPAPGDWDRASNRVPPYSLRPQAEDFHPSPNSNLLGTDWHMKSQELRGPDQADQMRLLPCRRLSGSATEDLQLDKVQLSEAEPACQDVDSLLTAHSYPEAMGNASGIVEQTSVETPASKWDSRIESRTSVVTRSSVTSNSECQIVAGSSDQVILNLSGRVAGRLSHRAKTFDNEDLQRGLEWVSEPIILLTTHC